MAKMTFKQYYKAQFKDVPRVWQLAKKHKKYFAFFLTMLMLLNPFCMYVMWLYDTGRMKIDNRFMGEDKNNG